jgi:hypothetical protein
MSVNNSASWSFPCAAGLCLRVNDQPFAGPEMPADAVRDGSGAASEVKINAFGRNGRLPAQVELDRAVIGDDD